MSADIYALARIPIKHRCEGYYLRWYYNGWHYWHFIPGQIQYETQGENYRTTGTRKLSMGTGQITYEQCAAIKTIRNCRELYIFTDYGWWNCIRIEPGSVTVYDHSINGYEIELTAIIGGRAISVTGYSPVAIVPVIPPDTPITYCEVDILVANQTWMCKAWDSAFPNSKVYDNDEANRAEYGGLYNWNQINSPGFVPMGWHIPTLGDWTTLFNAIGSIADAGGKLKEIGTTHWQAPNQDAVDTYGFAARSTGELINNVLYSDLLQNGTFWSSEESDVDYPPTKGIAVQFSYQYGSVTLVDLLKTTFAGVRLIKNIPNPQPSYSGWFLPSNSELDKMHDNLYAYGVGGFSGGDYWTSCDSGETRGWWEKFSTGVLNYLTYTKASILHVRPCITFTTTDIYSLRDTGPNGGLIFHIVDNGGTYTYYEAYPTDIADSLWSNIELQIDIGVNTAPIGRGIINTALIIAQAGHTNSAAKICNDLN